jgi:glycosyltransferase involved in cell wall biosynthesis
MKIAFVDVLGLPYDGVTLSKRGLGGSESAVIYMSANLVKLGFQVTVFCECDTDNARPGTYDGVQYKHLYELAHDDCEYDVIISSRSVEPFVPVDWDRSWCRHDHMLYNTLQGSKAHKVLWMHDTFCSGDHVLEQLVMHNHFQEMFVLSDWHMTYVLNCDHGARRNYEVLKRKTWITRNGVNIWQPYVDVSTKDPWQFVYNASVSKGMQILLEHVWPRIHEAHPEAKLKVIGGYYKFRSDQPPDEQEQLWHRLKDAHNQKLGVHFTGIIPQPQIAEILAASTAMIYPNAFPETFGISALESLCYNTPLITNRFGALEETAVDIACYKVDYAIQPNSLFPLINTAHQVDAFVHEVLQVIQNRYLLQQKQHACSIVKPWVTWNTVALQWKQHFFRITDRMLSSEEFIQSAQITTRIQQIFGRRTTNPEGHQVYQIPEQPIVIISPFRNAENYISRCIMSVATQSYTHVTHILIDDASTDSSYHIAQMTINSCPVHIQSRIQLWQNTQRVGAVGNQFQALQWVKQNCAANTIVCLLDGDDWLVNRNDVLHMINRHMDDTCDFSYGSSWSVADQIPLIAQEYPPDVRATRSYRSHKFTWIIPYTHMRTFRIHLFDAQIKSEWQSDSGEWWLAGGDTHVFYSLIERVHPDRIKVMQDVIVNYNDENPLNDYKVHAQEQTATAHAAISPVSQGGTTVLAPTPSPVTPSTPHVLKPTRILLAIPTAKYVEVDTFKSMWDLHVPANCELEFQYFYGYNIQQIRNLQVIWMLNNQFDHVLHVDSDMTFPPHTLEWLLYMQTERRAITSGCYVQRKESEKILEVYVHDVQTGGHVHLPVQDLAPNRIMNVQAVGFGCCLVRRDVYEQVSDPWFEYHNPTPHKAIVSEDVDLCMKATQKGFEIGVHTGLHYGHIHKTVLRP